MFLRKGFRKYGHISNSAIYKKKKENKYSTCKNDKGLNQLDLSCS